VCSGGIDRRGRSVPGPATPGARQGRERARRRRVAYVTTTHPSGGSNQSIRRDRSRPFLLPAGGCRDVGGGQGAMARWERSRPAGYGVSVSGGGLGGTPATNTHNSWHERQRRRRHPATDRLTDRRTAETGLVARPFPPCSSTAAGLPPSHAHTGRRHRPVRRSFRTFAGDLI